MPLANSAATASAPSSSHRNRSGAAGDSPTSAGSHHSTIVQRPGPAGPRRLKIKRARSHTSRPSIGPLRFKDWVSAFPRASWSESPRGSILTPAIWPPRRKLHCITLTPDATSPPATYSAQWLAHCASASQDRNVRTASDVEELDRKAPALPARGSSPSPRSRKEPAKVQPFVLTEISGGMDDSLPICGSRFLVSMSIFRPYLILGMTAMFRLTLGGSNEKLFVVWDRHRERPYASVRTRLSAAGSRNESCAYWSRLRRSRRGAISISWRLCGRLPAGVRHWSRRRSSGDRGADGGSHRQPRLLLPRPELSGLFGPRLRV